MHWIIWLLVAICVHLGGGDMAQPYLSRYITANDMDHLGLPLSPVRKYDLEWLKSNLLTNGDFETGDLTGWTEQAGLGTVLVDGAYARSGSYGAKFEHGALIDSTVVDLGSPLKTTTWVLSFYGQQTGGDGSGGVTSLVAYYNASMAHIGTDNFGFQLFSEDSWTQYSNTLTIPGNARYLMVRLHVSGMIAADIYVDDIFLTGESTSAPTVGDFAYLAPDDKETFTFPDGGPRSKQRSLASSWRVTRLESGVLSKSRSWAARNRWEYAFGNLTQAMADQFWRFVKKVMDTGHTFFYTDPDGVTHEVDLVDEPSERVQGKTGEYWGETIEFEEIA